MRYLSTTLGTLRSSPSVGGRAAAAILRTILPRSNPDLDDLIPHVARWYVEIDDSGMPQREVGLDASGRVIVAAPIGDNLGFWTDHGHALPDADFELVPEHAFEALWREFETSPLGQRLTGRGDA